MVVPVGEETEINLRQFSRKVEIKGFNRERIEKGREDEDHNMTYGSRCHGHCSISKWQEALLSFNVAGGIAQFQSGCCHSSVSKWLVALLSFQVAGCVALFLL